MGSTPDSYLVRLNFTTALVLPINDDYSFGKLQG